MVARSLEWTIGNILLPSPMIGISAVCDDQAFLNKGNRVSSPFPYTIPAHTLLEIIAIQTFYSNSPSQNISLIRIID